MMVSASAEGGEGANGGSVRRSEITPELIELSKRAKELGFPQDVEEGDWVKPYEYIVLFNPMSMCIEGEIIRYANGLICDNWFLILSFSRCEEFLGKDVSKLHEDSARRVIEKLQK